MSTELSSSEIFPQSTRGKVAKAKALKDEGNTFFKQEKYSKAKQRYATALAYTRGLPGREGNGGDNQMAKFAEASVSKMEPAENQEVDELDAILKTNIAACFLKLNRPADALQYAREAKVHNPLYWKASLRAAEAMELTKNYDGALKQLDLLSHILSATSDAGAVRTMRTIREKVAVGRKVEKDKQKKAFGNIFERMNKDLLNGDMTSVTAAIAAPLSVLENEINNTENEADEIDGDEKS